MASAKLEILISAKETATRTMDGVKAAFARRTQEIEGMATGFMKNGEKIEKFLHGISLLKMATETEGFKKALNDISPTLQKATSDMLNYGVAIGGTLSLLKDLAHLRTLSMFGPTAMAGAVAGGTALIGQSFLDSKAAQAEAAASGQSLIFAAAEEARKALSEAEFDQAFKQVTSAGAAGIPGAFETAAELLAQKREILARNQAMSAETKAIWARAAMLRKENEIAAQNRTAVAEVKAIQREAFRATPAGQFDAFRDTGRNLGDAKRLLAGTNPETQAVRWLELNTTVQRLTAEMETLNGSFVGKLSAFMQSAPDRLAGLFRPSGRGTGAITTTSLGTLPGSPVLADALSRQGLFAGGGRANPLTGLTERTLTSIDSGTKEQVRYLRDIWKVVTTGNLGGLAQ